MMRRPRFQFRLSTLLWITLAVACWFGGMRFGQWREIRAARYYGPPSGYGPQPGPSPASGPPIQLKFKVPVTYQPQAIPLK
jgi:hypothetical protein